MRRFNEEHPNYCRSLVKQLTQLRLIPSADEKEKLRATHLIDLASASQKFILPPGGILIEDAELKAIDGDEKLRLPHPFVALEFLHKVGGGKVIVFAREHLDSSSIAVTVVGFVTADGCWDSLETFFIPTNPKIAVDSRHDRLAHINIGYFDSVKVDTEKGVWLEAASVVLSFLNALQCSNVHIARSDPKKAAKKVKAALPFDTYHILTIDVPGRSGESGESTGPHRSPREHLRRGHIRRLSDGRRIWINAAVVAAGRGAGVVKKDHALRLAS